MKKTTILALILCTCIVQVNWGAEAKQTSLEKTLTIEPIALTTQFKKPNEPRPVYKVTSSIPLWFTDIQQRIANNIPVDAKDRAFVEKLHCMVVIGNLGGIIYYFADKPTEHDIRNLTRQFPYANMIFVSYKPKDSYCVDFQPKVPDTPLEHEMNRENIEAFLETIEKYRERKV